MKKWSLAAVAALSTLVGCSQPEPMTADKVVAALQSAGTGITAVKTLPRDPSSPRPSSFRENIAFALPSVAPKGGQLFVCDKREYCDAIFSYYDALKGLAGPYLYRSGDGLIVAQLNSGLEPKAAEQVQAVVEAL